MSVHHFDLALYLLLAVQGSSWAAGGVPTTVSDLVRMHQGQLQDSTILDFLQTYGAILVIPELGWQDLAQAGFSPATLQTLRARTQEKGSESGAPRGGVLPRFFVGYAHDAKAFPAWYYGPMGEASPSATQHPGRGSGHSWRGAAQAVWFHGRRL